jgi:Zn-finger nucleic acid-binding protein
MKCPVDSETLVMTERSGVEIDYCPKCRGVWLDRGELDKIIERSAAAAPAREAPRTVERGYEEPGGYKGHSQTGPYRKKREGFLGELFDF